MSILALLLILLGFFANFTQKREAVDVIFNEICIFQHTSVYLYTIDLRVLTFCKKHEIITTIRASKE